MAAGSISMQQHADKQFKPLLDGIEEEKYGANNQMLRSSAKNHYAHRNNCNLENRPKFKCHERGSAFLIICMITVSAYCHYQNDVDPVIQAIISTLWCCRVLVRMVALYINDRWYFGSKSKFTKMRSELFKFKEFGRISLIWISLSILFCVLLVAAPFIDSWCGALKSQFSYIL